jgi:hypothetical protein
MHLRTRSDCKIQQIAVKAIEDQDLAPASHRLRSPSWLQAADKVSAFVNDGTALHRTATGLPLAGAFSDTPMLIN